MVRKYPRTPDGRYFVSKGRLWRTTNPGLDPEVEEELVSDLMTARGDIARAKGDAETLANARARVHAAKVALGERGPVWWTDGAPDYLRHAPKNTPYAEWWAGLSAAEREAGTR